MAGLSPGRMEAPHSKRLVDHSIPSVACLAYLALEAVP